MSKWIGASFVRLLALAGYNPFIIAKLSGDRMFLRHIEDGVIGFIPVVFLILSANPLAFISQSAKTLLSFDYTRYKDFWKDLLSWICTDRDTWRLRNKWRLRNNWIVKNRINCIKCNGIYLDLYLRTAITLICNLLICDFHNDTNANTYYSDVWNN